MQGMMEHMLEVCDGVKREIDAQGTPLHPSLPPSLLPLCFPPLLPCRLPFLF